MKRALDTWDGMTTSGFVNDPYPHVETTLSEILDLDVPPKYNLSPKACIGILRRARKRGKDLPPMLKEALMEAILITGMTMEEIDASTMPDAVGSSDGEDL